MPRPIIWTYADGILTDGNVRINPAEYSATSAAHVLRMSWQNSYNIAKRLGFAWKPPRKNNTQYDMLEADLVALERLGGEWGEWVKQYRMEIAK